MRELTEELLGELFPFDGLLERHGDPRVTLDSQRRQAVQVIAAVPALISSGGRVIM